MLAVGMLSGLISVRNQQAEEILRVERRAPVWCLVFIPDLSPPKAQQNSGANGAAAGAPGQNGAGGQDIRDLLVVGSWDKIYSLYK